MKQDEVRSKLELEQERVVIPVPEIISLVSGIFENIGCSVVVLREVAEHLAEANLCAMESHCRSKPGSRLWLCRNGSHA